MADHESQELNQLDLLILKHFHLLDTKTEETSQRLKELADHNYRKNHNITSLIVERYEGQLPKIDLAIDIADAFSGTAYCDSVQDLAVQEDVFRVYGADVSGFEYISDMVEGDADKNGVVKLSLEYVLIDYVLKFKVTFESTKKIRLPAEQSPEEQ
ncbi:MAG: hypothetical protein AABX64_00715 [Nanoarchaeota archaeon]